jgi:hypothetical protein
MRTSWQMMHKRKLRIQISSTSKKELRKPKMGGTDPSLKEGGEDARVT